MPAGATTATMPAPRFGTSGILAGCARRVGTTEGDVAVVDTGFTLDPSPATKGPVGSPNSENDAD